MNPRPEQNATKISIVVLVISLILSFGCALSNPQTNFYQEERYREYEQYIIRPIMDLYDFSKENVILDYAQKIATDITSNIHDFNPKDNIILVATFADVNNLQTSLNFGRTLTDCLISSLNQQHFKVIELRKTLQVYVEEKNGEYLLSRKISEINTKLKAHACVVGTYSLAYDTVIVNTRLIDMGNSNVISSSSLEIPIDKNIQHLLTNSNKTNRIDGRINVANVVDDRSYFIEKAVRVFERR